MQELPLFTLLPPFYQKPLYHDLPRYFEDIEKEFPVKVKTYSYLRDAFQNDVFIINKELLFRFPRTAQGQDHLKDEISFLEFLKDKVKTSIPIYKYISKNGNFAGYKIIPDKILSPATFQYLSQKNKESVANQLIDFINFIHGININTFKKFKPRSREEFISIEKQVEKDLAGKLFPLLSNDEVEKIKHFYQESKKVIQATSVFSPTHGDLYAYNIVWNKKQSKVGVIDFSDLIITDPAKDFEVFYDYGPKYAELAYEKYKGPKDPQFLHRAEIYYKMHTIYTLLSSQLGSRMSFEYAYNRFKKRFA